MFSASCLHPVSLVTVQPGPHDEGIVSPLRHPRHHSSQQTCEPCLTMFEIESMICNTRRRWRQLVQTCVSSYCVKTLALVGTFFKKALVDTFSTIYIPNIVNVKHRLHALHLISGVIVALVNSSIFGT